MKVVLLAISLAVGVLGGCTKESKQEAASPQKAVQPMSSTPESSGASAANNSQSNQGSAMQPPSSQALLTDLLTTDSNGLSKATVVMKTTRGTVKFKFFAKDAPNTVKRIAELIQQKFYNGLSFHRIVQGFVVQTGDPKSRDKNDRSVGTGGSGVKLKAEFNGRRHVRGTVGMARNPGDPDSADSQFYITLNTFPHLDNTYTSFGMVTDFGEKVSDHDVLDRIRQGDEVIEMHLE